MCVNEGFFGWVPKLGSGFNGGAFICRTCDGAGVPTGEGSMLFTRSTVNNGSIEYLRYGATPGVAHAWAGATFGHVPHNITDTTVGANKMVFVQWGLFPEMKPIFGVGVYVLAEIPNATEITVALVGPTPRKYLTVNCFYYIAGNANYGVTMLWE
jgi:hypothetical protein